MRSYPASTCLGFIKGALEMYIHESSNLNLRCCWRFSNDEESRLFKRSPFDIPTCFRFFKFNFNYFSVYIYIDKHQHESTLKIMFKHVVLNASTQCAFNVVFLMQSCMRYRIFWTHTFYMHAYMHGYMHTVIRKPSHLHHVKIQVHDTFMHIFLCACIYIYIHTHIHRYFKDNSNRPPEHTPDPQLPVYKGIISYMYFGYLGSVGILLDSRFPSFQVFLQSTYLVKL